MAAYSPDSKALAEHLIRRHQHMMNERAPWEDHWKQIQRRVSPRGETLNRKSPGGRRTEWIFDSTATIGLERFAAAMEGLCAPRGQRWHGLRAKNPRLNAKLEIRRYCEQLTDLLFDARYSAGSGFATQLHETMLSLGGPGTGALWIEDGLNYGRNGLVYRALDVSEYAIDVDANGRVDSVARDIEFTVRQAIQKWGMERLPKAVLEAKDQPDRKFTFCHVVEPRQDFNPERMDAKGMRWGSWYLYKPECHIISEGGFHTMPLPVCRYTVAPREIWGRSVAMMALPDIKMANEIAKTLIAAAHKALDPALLIPEDGALSRIATRPGALNAGGLNARGEPMVRPLETGGNLPFGMEVMEQTRKVINDAFLVNLFQVLVDGPDRMTATEVLERVRERGVLLAPAAGRIETELLEPTIEREIDLLARAGALPEMPAELQDAGGQIEVAYENPMSRAAKTEQVTGFLRLTEAFTPAAAIDPSIWDRIDFDAALLEAAQIIGAPARWLRDDDALAAVRQQREQAKQQEQALAAIPGAAGAVLDLAKARQVGGEALPVAA